MVMVLALQSELQVPRGQDNKFFIILIGPVLCLAYTLNPYNHSERDICYPHSLEEETSAEVNVGHRVSSRIFEPCPSASKVSAVSMLTHGHFCHLCVLMVT